MPNDGAATGGRAGARRAIILVNELTLPRLLLAILLRRDVLAMPVPAIFGPLAGMMDRILAFCFRKGLARPLKNVDARLARLERLQQFRLVDDAFAIILPWAERHFRFAAADAALGDDAMPYKQVVANHLAAHFAALHFLRVACATHTPDQCAIHAPGPVMDGIYRAFFGEAPSLPFRHPRLWPGLVKAVTLLAFLAAAPVLALRGARRGSARREWLMGVDPFGVRDDLELWREVARHGPVLAVHRGADTTLDTHEFPAITSRQGGFPLARVPGAVAQAWRRTARLAGFARGLRPELFYLVAALPLKRLLVQRLLASHRFRHFFARDDYNVDHILRSQELRRDGGISLGISHGLPIAAIVVPMWCYLDFDVYYVHGMGLARHYRRTWAPHMKVVAVGSRGMSRQRFARLAEPRPDTILVQCKPWLQVDPLVAMVRQVAERFPDHQVLINIKKSFRAHPAAAEFLARVTAGLSNVAESDRPIYDLFLESRVLITDPSTVAAEAVQFGLMTFVLDVEDQRSLYFRDFPAICFRDPLAVADALDGAVRGTIPYPWHTLEELTARPDMPYCEAVCATLDLAPVGTPR